MYWFLHAGSRCLTYVPNWIFYNTNPSWTKFEPKALEGIFARYSLSQKGYKCYYLSRKFFVSSDVTFYEDQPFYPPTSFLEETACVEWPWDPLLSLLMLDFVTPPLLVCSQGRASTSTPDNTLVAALDPLDTSMPDLKNLTLAPKLLVYSKRPKDHQQP